jgi:hypothetical protein
MRKQRMRFESSEDIIQEALNRGAKLKAALLSEAGGPLFVGEVAALLGISEEQVTQRKSLLALPLDGSSTAWPAFQFESQAMMDGVEAIMAAIQVDHLWSQLHFLFLPTKELCGKTAVQVIREGSPAEAVLAARHYGDHGAS